MKKKKFNGTSFVCIALIIISFIFGTAFSKVITVAVPSSDERENANVDFPEKEKFTAVEPRIDGSQLSFSSDCYALSFGITEDQAYSIFRGLQKSIDERPLTHDTIKDVFEDFNIDVKSARIDDKRDGIYTARLLLVRGNKVLDIDVRPSDATAIAIRESVPIYIKTSILEQDGTKSC